jgi:hypothetical protein
MVFAYLLPEVRNHPELFVSNGSVCQVTPRLKAHFARNIMHYFFPEYFQSLISWFMPNTLLKVLNILRF